jgi:enamine deaminase RidA (YjgF/YER057c/UK114 family)
MNDRREVLLGGPFEQRIGFARAVRVGDFVAVGGTAPIAEDGTTEGVGDPAAQARRCYEIIATALEHAGASLDDVIRTRTMLTRIDHYAAVAEVRKAVFGGRVLPVDTIVEVSRFVNEEWLVEIEVDAIVTAAASGDNEEATGDDA